jgi:Uncharacterized conserved protein
MKKILLISVALFMLITNGLFAQQQNTQNYIEVSTRAEKQITPDEIYLNIILEEQTSKGKISVEKQEKEMIKSLKGLGIDVEKNLTVKNMDSDLQNYFLRKDAILTTKSFTLKLSTAKEMGNVFDALNKLNISNVSLWKTAISPELEKQTKDELLIDAAKKAKENASILAEAVGSKAGKAVYIQNYYSFSQPYNSMQTKSMRLMSLSNSAADTYEETSIEMEKTTLSVNVLCRFAIE